MEGKSSGLYRYYENRARSSTLLSDVDRYLVRYVFENYPRKIRIHEIACGAAQLGHALCLLGFQVDASEIDRRRADYARAMGQFLGSECRILHVRCQDHDLSGYDLVLTINAAGSHVSLERDQRYLLSILERGADLIFNPALYGTKDVERAVTLDLPGVVQMPLEHELVLCRGLQSARGTTIVDETLG